MKTKREVLKEFVTHGDCKNIKCENCSYSIINNFNCQIQAGAKLSQIGAMAILRMFPEKKKLTLQNLSRIRFSDGRFAMVFTRPGDDKPLLDFGDGVQTLDYLFNRTWEIVE